MNVYTTDKIRNVVLLGHGGCGKTSLVEAMAYLAGLTSRMGKIDDGNTISDFGKEEQKRKFSINTSLVSIEWEGTKINLLDTPGYFDFVGEVEEAVAAADAAIIVVSGKSGFEVGTEKAWDLCEERCAKLIGGKCTAGVKIPPDKGEWPMQSEECRHFESKISQPA